LNLIKNSGLYKILQMKRYKGYLMKISNIPIVVTLWPTESQIIIYSNEHKSQPDIPDNQRSEIRFDVLSQRMSNNGQYN